MLRCAVEKKKGGDYIMFFVEEKRHRGFWE